RPASSGAAEPIRRRRYVVLTAVLGALGLAAWFAGTVALAVWLTTFREPGIPRPPLWWMLWAPAAVGVAWVSVAVGFLYACGGRVWRYPLGKMWLGLAASAGLAVGVTAVQLFPAIEFTQQTSRAAGGGPHDIYPFGIEPYRLIELLWPNVLGVHFGGNRYWANALTLPGMQPKVWVPSLYLGGLTFVLSLSVLTLWRGRPWRVWLSAIVLVSLVASLGEYTSPIWITRVFNGLPGLGPVDPIDATPIRLDGYFRDGDGGFYWWLTTILPGFRQFRFPAKLFTFTTLGLAALAGMGWDGLSSGRNRPMTVLLSLLIALTLGCLGVVLVYRTPIMSALEAFGPDSSFGPFHADGAYAAIVRALIHGLVVLGLGVVAVRSAAKRPVLAGTLVLVVMTADLALANAQYILTVPQRLFEGESEVLAHINAAERDKPSPGPFRIHRMALWSPPGWGHSESPNRVSDFVSWERGTLQPKYGINLGVEYTHTLGVAELYDYEWYFAGFPRAIRDPAFAKVLPIEIGKEVVYYPRRAFDMWNTRYFVVPAFPNGWRDEMRAFAAFRFQTELLHPKPSFFDGPNFQDAVNQWVETKDYQIFRNLNEYPRAWVVHSARAIKPGVGLSRESRADSMQEIVYADDPIWHDETQHVFDPRKLVWIDNDRLSELESTLSEGPPKSSERVDVTYPSPQTAVLEATLESPGIVVLADVFYPGWELTIDGKPAPIYRVNRMMRGAAVRSGKHRLVYRYNPASFRIGRAVSVGGLVALLVFGALALGRPDDPLLAGVAA
ncbi:MAG TPA: YfhO family protein, partial [Isosphaeraceae bacterium]|nr:YfhO family protein [Isosphaeraceae bacterium]